MRLLRKLKKEVCEAKLDLHWMGKVRPIINRNMPKITHIKEKMGVFHVERK